MQKSIFIFSFAPANIIKEEDENPEQSSHTVKLKQHFNMKHFTYLLLIAIFLIGYKAKAQTSASMGLNGVVENYTIQGKGNSYSEYAEYNTRTKKLISYDIDGTSFKVKGNRPSSFSKFIQWDMPAEHNGENWISYSHTFTYSGKYVSKYTYVKKIRYYVHLGSFLANIPGNSWRKPHKIKKWVTTYRYTKNDQFGNWIERCATSDGESWTETRTIQYDKEWLKKQTIAQEKKQIANYEKNNDIAHLETYLKGDLLDESKSYGLEIWNIMVCRDENLTELDTIKKHAVCSNAKETTKAVLKQAWSSMKFQQLKVSNNHNGLYYLAMDSLCTKEIADSARAYWNEKEWALVSDKNTSYQDIAKVAAHPFAYPEQAQAGWRRVQQQYYDKVVLSHNDFRDVERDYKATLEGKRIFSDIDYAKQVTTRLDSLRNAEISAYLCKAQSATSNKAYKEAVEASQHVLSINPNHPEAIELSAENGKHYLEQLKKQKKLTDEAIKEYIDQNPFGKYTLQMKDMRAVRLAKLAHSNKQLGEFDSIAKLPMSDEARKEVNSLSKRTDNRMNRGNFLHFGAEASLGYGFGADMLDGGGGAYVRLGWTVSPINVTTGFTYTAHKNKTLATSRQNEEQGIINGAMDYSTMEIPLQLRWNFMHNTELAFYLAAGAEYHLNKKGEIAYKDPESREKVYVKDDALLKKNNFVGYYSLGLELKHLMGMELYVKHDYTDRFDKNYVRQQYGAQSASNLLLFDKAEKSQLGKNWSIGVKIRIFY